MTTSDATQAFRDAQGLSFVFAAAMPTGDDFNKSCAVASSGFRANLSDSDIVLVLANLKLNYARLVEQCAERMKIPDQALHGTIAELINDLRMNDSTET